MVRCKKQRVSGKLIDTNDSKRRCLRPRTHKHTDRNKRVTVAEDNEEEFETVIPLPICDDKKLVTKELQCQDFITKENCNVCIVQSANNVVDSLNQSTSDIVANRKTDKDIKPKTKKRKNLFSNLAIQRPKKGRLRTSKCKPNSTEEILCNDLNMVQTENTPDSLPSIHITPRCQKRSKLCKNNASTCEGTTLKDTNVNESTSPVPLFSSSQTLQNSSPIPFPFHASDCEEFPPSQAIPLKFDRLDVNEHRAQNIGMPSTKGGSFCSSFSWMANNGNSVNLDNSDYLPTPVSSFKEYHQKSKELSVDWSSSFINLDDISCSDSDEELPEGLTPTILGKMHEGDTVWLKYKGFPRWPAKVSKLYFTKKKIQRITVEMIHPLPNMDKKYTVMYNTSRILPFLNPNLDQFMKEGNEHKNPEYAALFKLATEEVISERDKKALKSLPTEKAECHTPDHKSFEESQSCALEKEKMEQVSESRKKRKKKNLSYVDDIEKCRAYKIREKNEKLVKFCTSDTMKSYLTEIWNQKRKSERHEAFMGTSAKARDSLMHAGFGPIADEEQIDDIALTLSTWLAELEGTQGITNTSYIVDVWIPEAIVYGLIRLKGYGRTKAWEQFEKGVRITKKESERLHQYLIRNDLSVEDKEFYDQKYCEKMKALIGDEADNMLKIFQRSSKASKNGVPRHLNLR